MDIPVSEAPVTVRENLFELSPITPGKLGHSTVLSAPGVRVIVLAFEAGRVLEEHIAPKQLLMQALDGRLVITAAGKKTTLVPGGLMRLDESLPHAVEALEDSHLMLTLLG
jgi:quercetin dioxygenase-like cupin family protein